MYPTYHLLGRDFSTYTLMAGIGTILTVLYVFFYARRHKVTRDDAVYIYTFGLIGFGLGAKALYLILNLPDLINCLSQIQDKDDIAYIYSAYVLGGFAIQGGIIGFILLSRKMAKAYKVIFTDFYPVLIPALCFFCGFGRVGCLLEGCCYGIDNFPIQGVASALDFLMGIAFAVFFEITREKRENIKICLPLYLLFYSLGRFILDFFRGDLVKSRILNMTASQVVGLIFIVFSVIWLVLDIKGRRSYNS